MIDSEKETQSVSENPWKYEMAEAMQIEIAFLLEILNQLMGKSPPTNFHRVSSKAVLGKKMKDMCPLCETLASAK